MHIVGIHLYKVKKQALVVIKVSGKSVIRRNMREAAEGLCAGSRSLCFINSLSSTLMSSAFVGRVECTYFTLQLVTPKEVKM